jgi:hypothetical protein
MTCKREQFISLKTLSFLHSQSDHITASAPTLISVLNLRSIPWSQFLNILATLVGGRRLKAIWMIDHIDLAKWHWKNRCLIVSSWWQKTHLVLPCQFRFTRLYIIDVHLFHVQLILIWKVMLTIKMIGEALSNGLHLVYLSVYVHWNKKLTT